HRRGCLGREPRVREAADSDRLMADQQRSKPRFNPRAGDRRGKGPIGTARPTPSLWYGLALLLILGLAQMYYLMPAGRPIPYSEFKSMLKSGQVAEAKVGDQMVKITDKQGHQLTTTRVEDPKLTEELEAHD